MKAINPKISIVIPVYNGSNYMREAIDSAIAQTYKNIEIIVVNDGSVDNTDEIAKSYGDKIRYFSKENGGVSSALNLALREMKGEYFSWLSHDDVYYPNKIENQLNFLSKLPNKNVILYSNYAFIDEESNIIKKVIFDHQMLEKKMEYALLRSAINGCTLLIPRKAFDEYGFFDEKLKCTQDYSKWFEMMKSYVFIHMSEVLIKYRLHNLQDTNKNPLAVSEGNTFLIDVMKKLSFDDKVRLEGSEYNFYKEIHKFLINTSYEEAAQFSQDMMREIIQKNKKDKLVISIISHSSGKYGAERAMLDMIDILLKNNIFVHVVLPGAGPLEQELIDRNVVYDKTDIKWWANTDVDIHRAKEEINDSAIVLAGIVNKINPDIVYTISSVISEGAIAAKILGIPHIWNIAEFGKEEHGIKYLLEDEERMNFINQYSDKIFFVSEAIKDHYVDRININDKSYVFYPIINNVKKESKDKCKYYKDNVLKLAIIGGVIEGKGQLDAVSAISEIVKLNDKIELIIAGSISDEKYYNKLHKTIKDNNIEKNVSFIGFVDNVDSLMRQSDVILVCSVFEGFGRVTIEAMLRKKPVIGANSGATPELIKNGKNGFLYEPGNFEELAEKINFFADNPDKMKEFGEEGYDFSFKKFDKNILGEELINELYTLKGNKKGIDTEMTNVFLDSVVKENKKRRELEEQNKIMKNEIDSMKLSKFWKLQNKYVYLKRGIKYAVCNPGKFVKKHLNI